MPSVRPTDFSEICGISLPDTRVLVGGTDERNS